MNFRYLWTLDSLNRGLGELMMIVFPLSNDDRGPLVGMIRQVSKSVHKRRELRPIDAKFNGSVNGIILLCNCY